MNRLYAFRQRRLSKSSISFFWSANLKTSEEQLNQVCSAFLEDNKRNFELFQKIKNLESEMFSNKDQAKRRSVLQNLISITRDNNFILSYQKYKAHQRIFFNFKYHIFLVVAWLAVLVLFYRKYTKVKVSDDREVEKPKERLSDVIVN